MTVATPLSSFGRTLVLVLLDGVPGFNLNRIMAMHPLKIQKPDVVNSRYLHGLAGSSSFVLDVKPAL